MEAEDSPLSRPEITQRVTRGMARWLAAAGHAVLTEVPLKSGRRVDLLALDRTGKVLVIEVKSSPADYLADQKWQEYLAYGDAFAFAVPEGFPVDLLPAEEGLFIADGFEAAALRPPVQRLLAPARRKALTLSFARLAATRLHRMVDPPIPDFRLPDFRLPDAVLALD